MIIMGYLKPLPQVVSRLASIDSHENSTEKSKLNQTHNNGDYEINKNNNNNNYDRNYSDKNNNTD